MKREEIEARSNYHGRQLSLRQVNNGLHAPTKTIELGGGGL